MERKCRRNGICGVAWCFVVACVCVCLRVSVCMCVVWWELGAVVGLMVVVVEWGWRGVEWSGFSESIWRSILLPKSRCEKDGFHVSFADSSPDM